MFRVALSAKSLALSLLASSACLLGGAAQAQDLAIAASSERLSAPMDATQIQIAAMKEEIAALSAQVADLKQAMSASIKDVRTTQASQPQVSLANGRPTFSTSDGKNAVAIRGVIQFDAAHYDVSPLTTTNDLGSGTNFRRARLGIDGKAFGDWSYALWGEFGGSGGEAAALNQAYLEYSGWKPFGLTSPLRLRIGAWATPTGLEDATSNTDSLFLERPAAAELVRNLAGGDGRTGVGAFANGDHWYASGVLTGKVVGVPATPEFGQQKGYLTRVAFNPLHGTDYDLHLGANVQGILDLADTAAGPAVSRSLRLRERPEIRVDGGRLVDTGALPARGVTAYGLELGASWKTFLLAGETFKIVADRSGTGPSAYDPSFKGWYVAGAWTLTGERHAWGAANGGFRGIRPAKIFDPSRDTWGAFEVAGRYSVLDLDDARGLAGTVAPLGGVRGGEQTITTLGLNWYPNTVVRILVDQQWINVDRLSGSGVQIGEDVQVTSLRAQAAF